MSSDAQDLAEPNASLCQQAVAGISAAFNTAPVIMPLADEGWKEWGWVWEYGLT